MDRQLAKVRRWNQRLRWLEQVTTGVFWVAAGSTGAALLFGGAPYQLQPTLGAEAGWAWVLFLVAAVSWVVVREISERSERKRRA